MFLDSVLIACFLIKRNKGKKAEREGGRQGRKGERKKNQKAEKEEKETERVRILLPYHWLEGRTLVVDSTWSVVEGVGAEYDTEAIKWKSE